MEPAGYFFRSNKWRNIHLNYGAAETANLGRREVFMRCAYIYAGRN